MKRRWFAVLATAFLLAKVVPAAVCNVSTTGVAFGDYPSILNQTRDTSGSITVTCEGTAGEQVNYTLQATAGSGSFSARTMASADSSLTFNLYTDAARTLVFGDGSAGTATISGSMTLGDGPTSRVHTIYGRIPAGQSLSKVGSYIDQISVVLTY